MTPSMLCAADGDLSGPQVVLFVAVIWMIGAVQLWLAFFHKWKRDSPVWRAMLRSWRVQLIIGSPVVFVLTIVMLAKLFD